MKLQDIKTMDKEDVLGLLGLETKPSNGKRIFGTLGTFGIGLLVGAAGALLLAPKAGSELRRDLRTKLSRDGKEVMTNGTDAAEPNEELARPA